MRDECGNEAGVPSFWKKFRYRLEEWGCLWLLRALPRLSRRSCIAIAQSLGAAVYHGDAHGRAVALANLEAVFQDRMSGSERRRIARESYQNFARTMLDLFWARNVGPDNFSEYTLVEGFDEVLEQARLEKRGIVFVCAHQGNWEWAALAFAQVGGRAHIVAQNFKNAALTKLFAALRTHGCHQLIPQQGAMLRLLKCVLRGESTALLADLSLLPDQGALALETFGPNPLQICATQMHVVLAQRGNALLVPVVTEPLPDGRIRVIAHSPIPASPERSAHEIAQATWRVFEDHILLHPELWLWSYKHFRFRPKATTRPYPFYASQSEGFDSLPRGTRN